MSVRRAARRTVNSEGSLVVVEVEVPLGTRWSVEVDIVGAYLGKRVQERRR